MRGDTIIVKKNDDGPLRLFEVYLLSKYVSVFLTVMQHKRDVEKSPIVFIDIITKYQNTKIKKC